MKHRPILKKRAVAAWRLLLHRNWAQQMGDRIVGISSHKELARRDWEMNGALYKEAAAERARLRQKRFFQRIRR